MAKAYDTDIPARYKPIVHGKLGTYAVYLRIAIINSMGGLEAD